MLNAQVPAPVDRDDYGFLDIHSIFNTIQGEGPFAGHPATFIRLFGCNLQCPFCDTDYTSEKRNLSPESILSMLGTFAPTDDSPEASERSFFALDGYRPLVVITGGEPFRQHVTPLVIKLVACGYRVQIETNGVLYPGDDFPWEDWNVIVVCSPKTGKIHPETAKRVTAYKYVLSHDALHHDGLPKTALAHPLGPYATIARPPEDWHGPVYLNPMDVQDEAINLRNLHAVAESVMAHKKYIMGVQMHKAIGLP